MLLLSAIIFYLPNIAVSSTSLKDKVLQMGNLRTFLTSLSNENGQISLFWTDLTHKISGNALSFKWPDNINCLRLGSEQPNIYPKVSSLNIER